MPRKQKRKRKYKSTKRTRNQRQQRNAKSTQQPQPIPLDDLKTLILKKHNRFSQETHTNDELCGILNMLPQESIPFECLFMYIRCQDNEAPDMNLFQAISQFSGGYKLERKRMFDMKQKCSHHQYNGSVALMSRAQHLMHKFMEGIYGETEDNKRELHRLFGVGNCNECCIYLIADFHKITGKQLTKYKDVWGFGTDIDLGNNWTLALLTNIMQYPHLFDFVWNRCELRLIVLNELNILLWKMKRGCMLEHQRLTDPLLRNDPHASLFINIDYNIILLLQFQLLRNLKFTKKETWFSLIVNGSHFNHWMVFVLQQLRLKIFCVPPWSNFGWGVMINFVHMITYGFYYLVKYPEWTREWNMASNKLNHKIWFDELEKIFNEAKRNNERLEYLCIVSSLFCLSNARFVLHKHKEMKQLKNDVVRYKWYDMECHNAKCKGRRFRKQLKKCKTCAVARYCSRRCQKYDWQKGHKYVCDGLNRMESAWKQKQNEIEMYDEMQKENDMKTQRKTVKSFNEYIVGQPDPFPMSPNLKELVSNPDKYIIHASYH
eukprot:98473_1